MNKIKLLTSLLVCLSIIFCGCDNYLEFAADTTIMHVTELFAEAGRLLIRQIRRGTFDMEDVWQIIPYLDRRAHV